MEGALGNEGALPLFCRPAQLLAQAGKQKPAR
jgi:hypothetical protein